MANVEAVASGWEAETSRGKTGCLAKTLPSTGKGPVLRPPGVMEEACLPSLKLKKQHRSHAGGRHWWLLGSL